MLRAMGGAGVGELPAEMVERVFRLLSPGDLRTVVLVCRRWREVGEAPALWSWALLTLALDNLCALACRRLARVRVVRLVATEAALLEALLRHGGVRELTLDSSLALAQVDSQLLGEVVAGMERVVMRKRPKRSQDSLSKSQFKKFFAAISQSSSLQSLDLSHQPLGSVAPEVLADVVSRLETVVLAQASLTEAQATTLLATLAQPGTRLTSLTLTATNLTGVSPSNLAAAAATLTHLDLSFTKLSEVQVEAVVEALSSSAHLRSLELGGASLATTPSHLLVRVFSRLTSLGLQQVAMVEEQWTSVASALDTDTAPSLVSLDISENQLVGVEPMLLARALARVERVAMKRTKLTLAQVTALVNSIRYDAVRGVPRLRSLSVRYAKFYNLVDPENLATAVSSLEEIDLSFTTMKIEQVKAIFKKLMKSSISLKRLHLDGVDLKDVDAMVVAGVVSRVRSVSMSSCRLQLHQLLALLAAMGSKMVLSHLTLSNNNLSEVEAESLGEAVSHLERLSLDSTSLSSSQVSAVIQQALAGTTLRFLDVRNNGLQAFRMEDRGRRRLKLWI